MDRMIVVAAAVILAIRAPLTAEARKRYTHNLCKVKTVEGKSVTFPLNRRGRPKWICCLWSIGCPVAVHPHAAA